MNKFSSRPFSYLATFAACAVMSMTTACASGGWKLTREYAGFVNKQTLIVRVILYILTLVIFAVTVLIDSLIFNTMDFWNGTVSAGDYQFQQGNKTYQAHHEVMPDTQLKRSTLRVLDENQKLVQEVVLTETTSHDIEVRVDGELRGRVHGISEVPVASIYSKGKWVEDRLIQLPSSAQYARRSTAAPATATF